MSSKVITIFCASRMSPCDEINKDVLRFCDLLIEAKYDLVYGWSQNGMMGLVAQRFLEGGRKVTCVRPKHLISGEQTQSNLSEMIVTENLSERKKIMLELADVVVALLGGIGTLDEITEAQSLLAVKQFNKFVGILNSQHFYDALLLHYDNMERFGFTSKRFRANLLVEKQAEDLFLKLINYSDKNKIL